MKFSEMISIVEKEIVDAAKSFDFEVNKLSYSSKDIEKNDVFFAIKGYKTNGNAYIKDALTKGAKAVITDGATDVSDPRIHHVKDCRKAMAELGSAFYGMPSKKLKMIGVTGTNGKTTVTNIIYHALTDAGFKAGLIGTNGNFINNRFLKTEHTTPESIDLNRLLKEMVDEQVEFAVMEVSSHSLYLKRVHGIEFDAAIFTNLTEDHLDFHETMQAYFESKKMLFDSMKRIGSKGITPAVIYNCNDEFGSIIVAASEAERISYGFGCGTYSADDLDMDLDGSSFKVLVPRNGEGIDSIKIKSKLTGRFNVHNILAAIAALKVLKMNYRQIAASIASFDPVDGRFNRVKLSSGASAIIDYSHSPDSLRKVISAIREILNEAGSKGKVITVFGCGGNRDRGKRPVMGKIASDNSDEVIVTSDNPRDEEPMEIIEEIKAGIDRENFFIEPDREEAIKKAIGMAKKGDVILVAGKGHETYQEIKGVKHHLSDREIVEKYGK